MSFSDNYLLYTQQLQRFNIQTRRLRLISDVMEDYQDNMRRMMRLIECEMTGTTNSDVNVDGPMQNNIDVEYSSSPLVEPRNSRIVEEWLDSVARASAASVARMANNTTPSSVPESAINGSNEREVPFRITSSIGRTLNPNPNVRRGFIYTELRDPQSTETDSGLTSQQIENLTELIQYDVSMNETRCPIMGDAFDRCPITWDAFEPGQNVLRINACGHIFGQPALTEWLQRHNKCPVCRTSLVDLSNSSTSFATDTRNESSDAISQLMSGIINSVSGAINADSGYHESSMSFNVSDLMDAYTQLVRTTRPRNP